GWVELAKPNTIFLEKPEKFVRVSDRKVRENIPFFLFPSIFYVGFPDVNPTYKLIITNNWVMFC
ncbi:MAG: hypothetical protein O4808_17560, partial [Trichodesmium sp. St17_bin3_1_1]|nr:hypothetical protein [Trichodesmium sp. St17_bin3_1_1]